MNTTQPRECNDLQQAQAELWNLILSFLKSMSLKCAIELGIPDAIYNHGGPITLLELASAISVPTDKKPHLSRLLRMLAHSGFLLEKNHETMVVYDLTPVSRLVVNAEGSSNLSPFVVATLDCIQVKPSFFMANWFKQEQNLVPFDLAHACHFWELTSQNPEFNTIFNNGMVSCSSFLMDIIVRNCGDIFQGIESLVDVGGGNGALAKVIAESFPHVKCTVLDLPQVVGHLNNDGIVKFVSGDMFKYIPPADVVTLKWILHDWCDEDCVKILKLCKEAISSREAGKVIVVEIVVGSASHTTSKES
ncbi:hypothetical protein LUZ60_017753 [Juncus effusus]|nr:hypothetical protein LUZ60_017753 [Juncus effusus]